MIRPHDRAMPPSDLMQAGKRLLATVLVLALFGGALWYATQEHQGQQLQRPEAQERGAVDSVTEMSGLVSVDLEPFFADVRVQKILRERKLPVRVTRVGSRDMAAQLAAAAMRGGGPAGGVADFYFPAGVLAANQIADEARKAGINATQTAPFNSPMVVASWQPIAAILVANGIARPSGERVYALNMERLVAAMLARKRWSELKAAEAFAVNRGVLVSTTDVRKSNSAVMYLALASHALLGEVVTDRASASAAAEKLAGLFKRQGYQENYVNGNFDDYLQIGMGKAPLAFIYEYQIVGHALNRSKAIQPDMVLMYPEPTIVNKFVLLATSARARAVQAELAGNPELQRIAVEYGLRVADPALFTAAVKPSGLGVQERISQVIDPPAYELMSEMVEVLTREMAK
ncbi:hypothetical protein [Accumulibacter sp.]|uniref:hypothetical protein n=1 Tax=Accumulibacter sp. TaxID=2053492 RepID=UPI002B8CC687|nr:hypothetical protein [Accumulibacter sp.]HNC19470.1 hypothetical protein [Accumulibacter sp.]